MLASATRRSKNASCPASRSISERTRESSRSTVSTSLTEFARSSSASKLSSLRCSPRSCASRSMERPVTSSWPSRSLWTSPSAWMRSTAVKNESPGTRTVAVP